jgi:L-malate glycosyltransferase
MQINKKKILLVSHGAALGGSPISCLNIARHIDKSRFAPVLCFGEQGAIVERAKDEGFKVFVADKKGFLGLGLILKYIKLILGEKIDIVHLNTLTPYYKYPAIAAKLTSRKVAWFVRENPEEKRCVRLAKYLNLIADKIVTVSYDTAEHIRYANPDKLLTIHNGIDLDDFAPFVPTPSDYEAIGIEEGFDYIVCVSSLEHRKGIFDLVQGFRLAKDEFPRLKLLLVGVDPTKAGKYVGELKELISSLSLSESVVLYGRSKEVKRLTSISVAMILPSYWEGLSRSILEAMAMAKSVLASRAGGNPEQVIDGENGFLFDPQNPEQIAESIRKLFSCDAQILGNASRIMAEQKFDIKVTTRKIENLYESM